MYSLFLRQKISVKLGSAFVLLGLLSFFNFFLIRYFKTQERSDAQVVNVAGRQRMLSQQIAFFGEMLFDGKAEYQSSLASSIEICDQSLTSLKTGGIAPGFSEELPPTSKNIAPVLSEVEAMWRSYRESAKSLIKESTNQKSLNYLEAESQNMLQAFNQLVKSLC